MQSGTGINWSSCGSAGPAAAGQRQPVAKPYPRWLAELSHSHPLRDVQTVVDDYRSVLGRVCADGAPYPLSAARRYGLANSEVARRARFVARSNVSKANAQNPDVLLSNSGDGGKTWSVVRVASGSGVFSSVGDLLDKPYIEAWGNGNAIVTFTDFLVGQKGSFISATIHSSVTHDGGQTWSAINDISGGVAAASFTTPVRTATGRIFVSFFNTAHADGRDDFEVVEVSPSTGALIGGPFKIALVHDGVEDAPVAFGRQTFQDSVFRSGDPASLAADPTNGAHLAAVWSDMRNSPAPAANLSPYASITNSDVIISQSFDSGTTWSAPLALAIPNDQFMPWGTFDTSGKLRIGFFDRQYDAANHKYGYTLATETAPSETPASPVSFSFQQVSTALSDPTQGDRWFGRNVNANFLHATAFMGDYSNVAATPDGGVVAYWTDMRTPATFAGITRSGQDAFFAKAS